jgi:hypothetical protein
VGSCESGDEISDSSAMELANYANGDSLMSLLFHKKK